MNDDDKIAEIRSRVYDYVSANPGGEHADKARQLLATLPAARPSDSPLRGMHGSGDAADSVTSTDVPQGRTAPAFGSGSQPLADLRPHDEKPLIHEDPIGTALVTRAMGGMGGTLPELAAQGAEGSGAVSALNSGSPRDVAMSAGAGAALPLLLQAAGALGGKLMSSEGGRAAQVLADRGLPVHAPFDEAPGGFRADLPVKGGDFGGMPSGKAIEHLEAMKASPNLPRGSTGPIDAEIARIRGAASAGDPEVDAARSALKFHGPHMGDVGGAGAAAAALMHTGHAGLAGIPALALMAARNATPIAGRLAMPLANAAAAGGRAVPVSSMLASPLLQAATGRE
jgi:hypothetical protein